MCSEKPEVLDVPLWHRDILATRLQKLDNGEEHVSDWDESKRSLDAMKWNRGGAT